MCTLASCSCLRSVGPCAQPSSRLFQQLDKLLLLSQVCGAPQHARTPEYVAREHIALLNSAAYLSGRVSFMHCLDSCPTMQPLTTSSLHDVEPLCSCSHRLEALFADSSCKAGVASLRQCMEGSGAPLLLQPHTTDFCRFFCKKMKARPGCPSLQQWMIQ